jgi:hypothetical protein
VKTPANFSSEAHVARNFALPFSICLVAIAATGCSTMLRQQTASEWLEPPNAAAPAGSAAPSAAGGIQSQYYMTYREGSCGWPFGCSRGDTHVKRCKVNADNTVTCVEEANATKAFNP